MSEPEIDYRALFTATPSPCAVLDPQLVVVEANEAYLQATGRTREELVGQYLFSVHPDNPADSEAHAVRNLNASLERVLRSKKSDTMAVQKYDVPISGRPGTFQVKWWSPLNSPVLGQDGEVRWIIHRVEDLTEFMHSFPLRPTKEGQTAAWDVTQAEVYARAQELQQVNEELRAAHEREQQTALTLQQAMLHAPDLAGHREIAVRYMPAISSLNVCGDWYDVVDLSEEEFTVAVGDVVGHGLEAAAVMGMLRSALTAAVRAIRDPGQAMDVLSRYASTVDGALATTAAKAVVDTRLKHLTYTSAGHPPPVLARPDGTVDVLDKATDPPLGVLLDQQPRAHQTVSYTPGDTLVLYTDGLIERRGEDIDVGLRRLTDTVARHPAQGPEQLADTLLGGLGVADGGQDDIALIVARL